MSDKVELLKKITQIEQSPTLTAMFREHYPTHFEVIKACIVGDLIKKRAINLINRLTEPEEFEYRVTWEININSTSQLEAAKLAYEMILDPESRAKVFTVEGGNDEFIGEYDLSI